MLNNYIATNLKITLRSMRKDSGYAITGVFGLTVGIISFVLVLLWIADEFKFNNGPGDKKIGFVLANIQQEPGHVDTWVTTPYILGSALRDKYPAIAKSATVSWNRTFYFKRNDDVFSSNGFFATPEFVDIFDLPVTGASRDLLTKKSNGILVTRSFAAKYFGENWREADVVGKELVTPRNEAFEIVGIIPDVHHTSLHYEILAPYEWLLKRNPSLADWDQYSNKTYVELSDGFTFEAANASILHAIKENGPDVTDNTELLLQPYEETYLHGKYSNGASVGGRIDYIRVLALAGAMILLLAVINFVVLLTVRTSKRRKEIGVKKALGASGITARTEFLTESFLVFTCATVFALVAAYLLLPAFNTFTGKSIDVTDLVSLPVILTIAVLIVVSMIVGTIPLILQKVGSGDSVWRESKIKFTGGTTLRRSMIAAQYGLTLLLVVGSIVISEQSDFFLSKDLGINRSNVMIAKISNSLPGHKLQTLKTRLASINGVTAVSYTDANPLEVNNEEMGFSWEGMNKESEKEINFAVLGADQDILPALGLQLADGRTFYADPAGDSLNYLVNETAAKAMELTDAKEKRLNKGKIIGILKDFNFKSLYSPIDPLIVRLEPHPTHILIKTAAEPTASLISSINNEYRQVDPSQPIDIKFLEDEHMVSYKSEFMVRDLILIFTVISIVISAMGQLSLISYTTAMRTKEIGIRKVLGATESSILRALLIEFIILMAISFTIVIPVSLLMANSWLDQFAYHISVSPLIYVSAIVFIAVITFSTVWRTAVKAARQNPVSSLRYE